jgi:hypothetical protein
MFCKTETKLASLQGRMNLRVTTKMTMNLFRGHAGKCKCLNGANGGIRTRDLLITNQLLYRLSYIGLVKVAFEKLHIKS